MRKLTSNIGKSSKGDFNIDNYKNKTFKILIVRPNHRLGNLLLVTPIIKEIEDLFLNPSIDLFTKGNLSEIVFKNYHSIDKHIKLPKKPFDNLFNYFKVWFKLLSKRYDLVINIDDHSSSGRIASSVVRAKYKIVDLDEPIKYSDLEEEQNSKHIAIKPIITLRNFINNELLQSKKYPTLDLKLDADEVELGRQKLYEIFNNSKKTITIFTFATGYKMLPQTWWNQFYEQLEINFPMYNILEVLPIENVSQINFKAKTFYSKDIREIASVISNTAIFVGADSGIMHLSVSSKTPTIGLLSGNFIMKYKPYGNKNIGIDRNETSHDEIIKQMKNILS
jgi:ADP-heptose:LPS heptosyltransferase